MKQIDLIKKLEIRFKNETKDKVYEMPSSGRDTISTKIKTLSMKKYKRDIDQS